MQKFIEQIPATIRDELISSGLLDAKRTAAGKTLIELADEFGQSLVAKERTPRYICETVKMLKDIFECCKFKYWSNISPTRVENYLKDLRDKGISYRRSNGYLTAIKSFCEWMVKSYYGSESPVKHLTKLDTELDRRRERRAATPDEIQTLLQTTAAGPKRFGMSGYERALFYKLAVETGLRKNELRTLKASAFDFDNCTVTVETCYSKHRQKDVLPLRADLATKLQSYLANKLPKAKAFSATDKTADMLKADLADAEIPFIRDGKVLDFHALRHTFITDLRMVPTSVRQSLARHRSSAMTDRYTHTNLHDERTAIESLPNTSIEEQRAVKTGTDDKILPNSCFQDAQSRIHADTGGQQNPDTLQKPQLQRARQDSNLQPSDSKSANCNSKSLVEGVKTPISKSSQESLVSSLFSDSDLQRLVESWPKLSLEGKKMVMALVEMVE
ncbi:Tyrosine recombinase XerC [subsurface metagenome]